mmetsp:Transcript_139771/g.243313  ORF Transcript_139771/g.243313 Transcript_139771/m.243313 type:complete len:130 (-) Transcript_139771:365-754(-)
MPVHHKPALSPAWFPCLCINKPETCTLVPGAIPSPAVRHPVFLFQMHPACSTCRNAGLSRATAPLPLTVFSPAKVSASYSSLSTLTFRLEPRSTKIRTFGKENQRQIVALQRNALEVAMHPPQPMTANC